MSAILPGARVAGAKVHTTRGGVFRFLVRLFDASSGAPLAVLEADALTEIRTAAVTEVVAAAAAPGRGGKLAVFGTGAVADDRILKLAPVLADTDRKVSAPNAEGRDITVFKSVGIAPEDVAVANAIWHRAGGKL